MRRDPSLFLRCCSIVLAFLAAACGRGDERIYNVIEKEDLGSNWNCGSPGSCVEDYRIFLDLAGRHANPVSDVELFRQIHEVESGRVDMMTDPISQEVLTEKIIDILNIRFLCEDINDRLLEVTTIRKEETSAYYERELLFEDPYVGVFKGILLIPKGEGPFPGVVAIHGHRDDAHIYKTLYHGGDYPSHGYVILMLTMRAMALDRHEHEISRLFLLNGFALIGIRNYETLLGLKYLRYLPNVIPERIGLIGHSGGSTASNLTIRMEGGFKAYVSDLTIDYCEWGNLFEPYHCETIPGLYPYHLLINDSDTSPVPILRVPYGYVNRMAEIYSFFNHQLRD